MGLIPGLERSSGGGKGDTLQYSYRENPVDRAAWQLQSIRRQRVGHNLATEQQALSTILSSVQKTYKRKHASILFKVFVEY